MLWRKDTTGAFADLTPQDRAAERARLHRQIRVTTSSGRTVLLWAGTATAREARRLARDFADEAIGQHVWETTRMRNLGLDDWEVIVMITLDKPGPLD